MVVRTAKGGLKGGGRYINYNNDDPCDNRGRIFREGFLRIRGRNASKYTTFGDETLKLFPLASLTLKRGGRGSDDRWMDFLLERSTEDGPKRILFAAVNSLISVYVLDEREREGEGRNAVQTLLAVVSLTILREGVNLHARYNPFLPDGDYFKR